MSSLPRGHENEVQPTSIVINVTTNIKPSGQKEESITQEEQQSSCYSVEEVKWITVSYHFSAKVKVCSSLYIYFLHFHVF